jgi:tRNA acetyltransferase TAN1
MVIENLREKLKKQPDEFRYILRVLPIEKVVFTNLEEIKNIMTELSSKISTNDKFRVTVEKRHTELSKKEIIEAVADIIESKVDLKKPDKIVLIEVLGGITGISVIRPNDIFSVNKEKKG